MNIFEVVKQTVTTRQAAEMYGIRVSRNGMAVCPFHNDRNPSMKVDNRFHCFACQADGDPCSVSSDFSYSKFLRIRRVWHSSPPQSRNRLRLAARP